MECFMSKIEIYSSALCPFAQRIRIVLAEKGLESSEIEIDPRHRPPAFLAMSPLGKIPLLVHGDVRVWESSVIGEYLDESFPDPPLHPRAPAQRALARAWINFADARIYEPTHRLLLCADPEEQQRMSAQLADELRTIELQALAVHGGPYWLGEQFTLADVAFFPWFEQLAVLERFRRFRMPEACGRILRWRDAVAGRPAVGSVMRPPSFYTQGYERLFEQHLKRASAA
jgi:glutathione S-transferase